MSAMDYLSMDNGKDDEDTPSVAIPNRPWVMPLGFGAAVILGALVFWQLSANRSRAEQARLTDPASGAEASVSLDNVPPPPNLYAQATPAPPPPPVSETIISPPPPPPRPTNLDERLHSPSLIIDLTQPGGGTGSGGTQNNQGATPSAIASAIGGGVGAGRSADEEFAARIGVSSGGVARAQRMNDQAYTVAQGTLIPAVLETALNSDLPGYARAVVSRDVRSFDGQNVLAPRGSRLVGQYRSGVALGQSRAFVIWTRLIRPDGVGVELASPGTDALGRGGLEGRVDRHFLQRFGGAILLSLITTGAQLAANDSDTQVIIASTTGAASDAASVALQSDLNIAPTVHVPQGSPIRVFVSRDLDFSILREEGE